MRPDRRCSRRSPQLPEYYPTRVETELLITHGAEIARLAGGERVLVEFGSGSSRKTSLLIQALAGVRAYVPIDIAGESLAEAAEWLKEQHADVVIAPLIADFTTAVALPAIARRGPRLGFFSGSTIGNLTHAEAGAFLANAAQLLGQDSAFLIGVDLKKSPAILLPAYDDAKGVTAAFNLNLLVRINRELGGTFDLSRFAHEAVYDDGAGRIEMRLVSLADQTVRVAGQSLAFAAGERIHTENSHKYSVSQFQTLARGAGWDADRGLDRPGPAVQPASAAARVATRTPPALPTFGAAPCQPARCWALSRPTMQRGASLRG